MLSFPPHCSHKLQPLDRSVFGPLKDFISSIQTCAQVTALPDELPQLNFTPVPSKASHFAQDASSGAQAQIESWSDTIQEQLHKIGRHVVEMTGDGHCLLYSEQTSLECEGIMNIPLQSLCQKLKEEVHNHQLYYVFQEKRSTSQLS